MNSFSSATFIGPTIVVGPIFKEDAKPPRFRIDACYPRRPTAVQLKPSPRLEKALKAAGILGKLDPAKAPPPIETISSDWAGERDVLKVLANVFPESFRIGRKARLNVRFAKGSKFPARANTLDVQIVLRSKHDQFFCTLSKSIEARAVLDKGFGGYTLAQELWGPVRSAMPARATPGAAELRISVQPREETKGLDGSVRSAPVAPAVELEPIPIRILPGA